MKLVQVTADEAKRERDRHTYSEWGKGLTVPEYLEREQRLRGHRWARANMRSWAWVDEEGEVLSSCETFRMPSALDGRPGHTYAVASVYTEPRLRGRGHAARMMSALNEAVRGLDPDAHGLTLFSDVGPALYERSGYQACPAWDLVVPAAAGNPKHDVDRFIDEERATAEHHRLGPGADRFWIWPSVEQLDWHWERGRIYAEMLDQLLPETVGARVDDATVFWVGNPRLRLLQILLVSGSTPAVGRCLQAARKIAAEMGYSSVVAWGEPGLDRLAADLDGVIGPRAGSLPMVRPLVNRFGSADLKRVPRALWV